MIIRRNSPVPLALVALALSAPTPPARACATFEPTLFVSPYGPDVAPARFVAGELGVPRPTWIRAYLVVAYRHLAGAPLSPAEQAAALGYLQGAASVKEGPEAWAKSRAAVTGEPTGPMGVERSAGYSSYVNCGDDAFRRAATTLQGYVSRYGGSSSETRGWLAAQDAVFANCSGETPVFPEPLPASAPAPLRADRAYQLASARFYAGRLEDAQRSFEEIAHDASSPWREIAPYLAARAVLRQATLGAGDGPADRRLLEEARTRFRAVRDGAKTPELRRWAVGLLNFVELRLVTDSSVASAAASVLAPKDEGEFAVSFVHYRDLLFRVLGWGPDPGAYVPDPKDALTSWIVAFQDDSPRGLERALAGFSRAHTAPWTLAVLSKIDASHPRAAEVVEAARPLAARGPGQVAIAYHLARLATEAGRTAEARSLVDASLAAARAAGVSAENLFLELKARNAATFEEFAAAAPRRVVGAENERNFDEYTRDILNRRIPLDTLVHFAESFSRGSRAGADVRRVVLTRAILLGRADVARAFAPPGAKIRWDDPDWRVDAALDVLLKDSEVRPYVALDPDFSIAWWCSLPRAEAAGRDPAFLSADERRAAAEEAARLESVPPAATWFCREALAFADLHPDDPRAPEFLAGAVRATREGCADAETRALSKAAFRRLHARYADSPWAKRTKYWFEGRGWYPPPLAPASPPS